jgi:hypothetical protein
MCDQIHAAEPSEKASIGRANPRHRSRAERIRIMEIKIEKGVILSQTCGNISQWSGEQDSPVRCILGT